MAKCPSHPDSKPSLSIDVAPDGKVLMNCHAGCETEAIVKELGLAYDDLFDDDGPPQRPSDQDLWTPRGQASAIYDYVDEDSRLLYQVLRLPDKGFMQRQPDPLREDRWIWKLGEIRQVPYRLPKVIKAIRDGRSVFIVEGEKDVHSIEAQGETATCNSGGAGKWHSEFREYFDGAEVFIVADKDKPGYKHARSIAENLKDTAASVHMVEAKEGKDVTDHLNAGYALDDLVCTDAPEAPEDRIWDIYDFLAEPSDYNWLVPGLLESGDRLIISGGEGRGKSTLLQQFAVCVAAGVDPTFSSIEIPPKRVLLLDCENGERHVRRKLGPMVETLRRMGRPLERGMLGIVSRPSGLELTGEEDAQWLLERALVFKPDVIVLGPLYRLHSKDPNDELPTRLTTVALDTVRSVVGCAIILEAHAGHGYAGVRGNFRPTGSSLWLRWPEFGYGLVTKQEQGVELGHHMFFNSWRGPRDERSWPSEFRRSSTGLPWTGYFPNGRL